MTYGPFGPSESDTLIGHNRATLTGDAYLREVARGRVRGAEVFSTYGKRTTSGAESSVIWPNGAYTIPPSTGVSLSFVSTSVQDAPAGSGIRSVEVHYLDMSLVPQVATVALNGTTAVTNAITGVRFVQCMHMVSYGSGQAAAGNISAYTGANAYSYIAAGSVRCSSSVRMVPAGKRYLLQAAVGGIISGTAAAQGTIWIGSTIFESHNYTDDSVFIPASELGFQDGSFGITFPTPFPFYEGSAIGMLFSVDKAATVTGTMFGILEDV